jgi:YVTN family beta-propeller protein
MRFITGVQITTTLLRFKNLDKSAFKKYSNKTNFYQTLILSGVLFVILIATEIPIQNAFAHHILQEIQVQGRPMRLSVNDGLLFVSNLGAEPTVSVINTTLDELEDSIHTNESVFEVEGVPSKNEVYVAPFEGGQIHVYDLTSGNLTKTIQIPHSELTFRPPLADRLLRPVTVITGGWSMDYNPSNERLYVANYNANEIVIIDTNNDTVIGTISVPSHPITVKADPFTNTVLVTSLAANKLTFISGETNRIVKSLDTGTGPWGMDIDSNEHVAYVTNRGGNYVTVVDLLGQNIITKIPIGAPAQAISVDPSEHMIYTSYMEQDKILKIDGRTNSILSTIETGLVPQDLAVDSKTHKVYASAKFQDKIFVLGPRSTALSIPVVTLDTPTAVVGFIRIHGQDVQASEPFLDIREKSIIMNVSSPDGGDLTMNIPRAVLDAKQPSEQGGAIVQQNTSAANTTTITANDSNFRVLIDGKQVSYSEDREAGPSTAITPPENQATIPQQGAESREITFFVPKGSKYVEVIGTSTFPSSSSLALTITGSR